MSTTADIMSLMSTSGDVQYIGGYHEYIVCMCVSAGEVGSILIGFLYIFFDKNYPILNKSFEFCMCPAYISIYANSSATLQSH